MRTPKDQFNFTTAIPTKELGIAETRPLEEKLIHLLGAPWGVPAISAVMTTVKIAVTSVFTRLPSPNEAALQLMKTFDGPENAIRGDLADGLVESPSALKGLKHKHQMWCLCAHMRTSKNQLAYVYAGLHILIAIKKGKPVPGSGSAHLEMLLDEDAVPEVSIDMLLAGMVPDETVDAPWLHSLQKLWRETIREYSLVRPPPPSPRGRIVNDLMNSMFSGSAAKHAGTAKHRNLTTRQVRNAFGKIRIGLEEDRLHGALGVIVCVTGFSVETVVNLEILDCVVDGAWAAGISIADGSIKVNHEFIVNEPSAALMGCIPSSYVLTRSLPAALASNLRTRLRKHQNAKTLRDLYPEEHAPGNGDLLYPSADEITPTWTRFRYSAGIVARQSGMDCMSAFIASCDLNHIPRSKLHYASVSPAEISYVMQYMYSMAKWGDPEPFTGNLLGFGCRAVPTAQTLIRHDTHLVNSCDALRPGNHAGLRRLLAFHNSFVRLSAWRIATLLALRETTSVNLSAEVDEQNDTWIALHDKVTPNDQGQQPVPLCEFVRRTIAGIRIHCRDMNTRLSSQNAFSTDIARWCGSVARSTNVRLLCLATDAFKIVPVGTHDFTKPFFDDYELPPDVGRKVMENQLRHVGLPSSLIDAVLRHSVRGQHRLSAFSNSHLDGWISRTARAMDTVASSLFCDVVYGLSKE